MPLVRRPNTVRRPLPAPTRRPPPADPLLQQAAQAALYRYMPQYSGLERLQAEAAGTRDQSIANAQAMAAGIAAAAEKARPALAEVYKQAQQDATDGISKHLGKGQSGHLFNKLSAESQAETIGALSAGGALTQASLLDRENNAQTQAAYARTAAQRQYAGDLAKIQQTRQDVGAEQGQFLDVTYGQLRGEQAKATAQAHRDALNDAYRNAQLGLTRRGQDLTLQGREMSAGLTRRGQDLAHQDRMFAATHAKPRAGGAGARGRATPEANRAFVAQTNRIFNYLYPLSPSARGKVANAIASGITRGGPGVSLPTVKDPLFARAAHDLISTHRLSSTTYHGLIGAGYTVPRPWMPRPVARPRPLGRASGTARL